MDRVYADLQIQMPLVADSATALKLLTIVRKVGLLKVRM